MILLREHFNLHHSEIIKQHIVTLFNVVIDFHISFHYISLKQLFFRSQYN